jgi:branched-chain amino acid transport system ATP-binding protein
MHTSPGDQATVPRPDPYLDVRGLEAGYGQEPVISRVDVRVGKGEVVLIAGPNGAGKSTLLKALTGSLPVSNGQVLLGGNEITGSPLNKLVERGVGYIPQSRDVFESLKVSENLDIGGYLLNTRDRQHKLAEVLDFFPQLKPLLDRRAGHLSGGQRKMLSLGRVLMGRPSLLILDEPTANLSPDLARTVLADHVQRLARLGVAVLLVEQRVIDALPVADWMYVLVSGIPRFSGPASGSMTLKEIGGLFLGRAGTD